MGKTIVAAVAVAGAVIGSVTIASADGISVRHRYVRHAATDCGGGPCFPVGCPDRYSCYSLYGAYGPYAGPAYMTRYTYAGWYYRR